MRRIRVIPTLLLQEGGLYKTKRFKRPVYVGDPINTLRIFNEKEVDELVLLNIAKNRHDIPLPLSTIRDIVSEAFMPIAYGGGIHSLDQIEALLKSGVEKVVLNSMALEGEELIRQASHQFGVQSIVISFDVGHTWTGGSALFTHGGTKKAKGSLTDWAKRFEVWGAGELLVNAIDRECTYEGYDLELIRQISNAVSIPVVASGGAGELADFRHAKQAGASAVAAGSMFVFQRPNQAVLITYPNQSALEEHVFSKDQ